MIKSQTHTGHVTPLTPDDTCVIEECSFTDFTSENSAKRARLNMQQHWAGIYNSSGLRPQTDKPPFFHILQPVAMYQQQLPLPPAGRWSP